MIPLFLIHEAHHFLEANLEGVLTLWLVAVGLLLIIIALGEK